ncbi:Sodium/hydrogen exchanger 2 [Zea mays]|uniref:Sodium/hydrogen exchanger 2 n=1 Tax=Zea mays TaxID=4577 RepID=A0A1D6EB94_MAIZE|nr:Sodium/hydrogen exchanger 2 [Zea mays]
MKIQPILQWS